MSKLRKDRSLKVPGVLQNCRWERFLSRTWQVAAVFLILLTSALVLNGASNNALAQQRELRGVWYTPRISGGFVTQAQIAAAMDTIANNNFNMVFFLVWTQGYPLWRSKVFYDATGGPYWTDPRAGNRDIFAEAIAEAHRRGLEIEAWFEYGFVGGYSGNRPTGSQRGLLLDRNPSWRGRTQSGSDSIVINGSQHHYWMSHAHPDVQKFLINLTTELVDTYDIDGIELDRIRYPKPDWGYDSVTVSLYKAEKGVEPPSPDDAAWKRWRADKLNTFHKANYDSVKKHNAKVLLTNAPSHYSSSNYYAAYENFVQDWAAWVNDGYVDAAHLQMYVPASVFPSYLSSVTQYRITDADKQKKIFPGIAVVAGTQASAPDFLSLITTTRNAGLLGNAIWYYEDLNRSDGGKTYWSHLKSGPYREPAHIPLRTQLDWRKPGILINELDVTQADTTGAWSKNANLPGYFGPSLQSAAAGSNSIIYYGSIGADAWYDMYAFVTGHQFRTTRAPFDLFDSSGASVRVTVNQSDPMMRGWVHLGTRYFRRGDHQRVLRLSNEGIESNLAVGAGGAMLILNRKLSPDVVTSIRSESSITPMDFQLFPVYPNPFNSTATIEFQLSNAGFISLDVIDVLGRRIESLAALEQYDAGRHRAQFDAGELASGIYFIRLIAGKRSKVAKVLLVR